MKNVKSINVNELVDKKTVKDMLGVPLARVKGIAVTQFSHLTRYGENIGFKGAFVAVNLLTGEILESNCAFLPKGITQELSRQLDASEIREVEFSCDIMAIASDKNSSGYAWVAEAPQTKEHLSRFEELKKEAESMAVELLSLPAPEKKSKKSA